MTSLSKYACALILASGLAVPAYAATTGTRPRLDRRCLDSRPKRIEQ